MTIEKAFPFVKDPAKYSELKTYPEFKLYEKAVVKHRPLTRKEKIQITDWIRHSSYGGGTGIALQGWILPFDSVVKKFFVEDRYGTIETVYAPDKTSIRHSRSKPSSPSTIVEVPKRRKLREVS